MKCFLSSGLSLIVACAAWALPLNAQTVLYSTDFPDDHGWTITPFLPPEPGWAVDATPTNVLTSNSWRSAPYSLNFNNGVDFQPFGDGWAVSPPIDLAGWTVNPVLTFWCNWQTEFGICNFDVRLLTVGPETKCYTVVQCGPMGGWHKHTVPLSSQWGTVQVSFSFYSADGSYNDGAGWFIDDLRVTAECLAPSTYCTAKVNSQGCLPVIFTTGTPSISGTGSAFRIWAGYVLNQKVGLLIWGRAPSATPFAGGLLCVGPPVTRTAAQDSGGTALPEEDCSGFYSFQFSPSMMTQAGLVALDDVYSQYWSRDNGFAPPDNVGLTGGVHWEVCP